MSPEQILGENVDARSDVFSLGVVLYQLVCGARPFERGDETDRRAAAHRIRRDPPIPLHRRAPDVPRALERIVMRAIEKLPADRYATAQRLGRAARGVRRGDVASAARRARRPRAGEGGPRPRRPGRRAGAGRGTRPTVLGAPHNHRPRRPLRRHRRGRRVLQYMGRGEGYRVRAGERPPSSSHERGCAPRARRPLGRGMGGRRARGHDAIRPRHPPHAGRA